MGKYLNTLNQLVPNITDYVVQSGVSGIWTYRKWHSGVAECWCVSSQTISPVAQWNNMNTYVSNTLQFPFEFVAIPIITVMVNTSDSVVLTGAITKYTVTRTSVGPLAYSGASGQINAIWYITARGNWKQH